MHVDYKKLFPKWLYILNQGFNVLLYGLGSKKQLLETFHSIHLMNETVMVVNGFFPSLTIKDILNTICNDILNINMASRNYHEIVDAVKIYLHNNDMNIFLLIHNIDGVMLRNHKAQLILSRLASIPQIHLIASVDHIKTPLCKQNQLFHFQIPF